MHRTTRLASAATIFRGPTAAVTIPALVSTVLGLGAVTLAWPTIRPECDVRGQLTVNAEVTGWGAGAVCQQMMAQDAVLHESTPDGPEVCRLPYQGHTLIIHDPSGGLIGAMACANYAAQTPHQAVQRSTQGQDGNV